MLNLMNTGGRYKGVHWTTTEKTIIKCCIIKSFKNYQEDF